MAQTFAHSAAVTGCTESRESLTSAISLSFGSPLMATSVTGVSNGVSARTSTAIHGSPAFAVGSGKLSRTTSQMPTISLPSPEW